MTNYEWLIQKENLIDAFTNEYFTDDIAVVYCRECPNKMFCETCTVEPIDMFKRWLDMEHK